MHPVKPVAALDITPPCTPPLSIPEVNMTSPLSPLMYPLAKLAPPLFSDIGAQGATAMDLDTDTTSAEGLPDKMEKLNATCGSIFLLFLLFLNY